MSPGGTMMRVYDGLKARVITGEFPPGQRLDPGRLATELDASATPVRDALHRLTGERLIDSFQHEGFRQPQILEPVIRDLYHWCGEVMTIVGRAAAASLAPPARLTPSPHAPYAERLATCFQTIALSSPNAEHRFVLDNLSDRLMLYRSAEPSIFDTAQAELITFENTLAAADLAEGVRIAVRNCRRRAGRAAALAATLRARYS